MSLKRAARDDETAQLYDINDTSMFHEWLGKTMRKLGASGNGAYTQHAILEGKLDPEVARCEHLPHDMTFLGVGKSHNGTVYAQGLTVGQLSLLEPLPPRAQRTDTERTRAAYSKDSVTAINYLKMHMEGHTIAYLENIEEFNAAVEKRDMVKFGQILKTRGIIGTGEADEARRKVEKDVYDVDRIKTRKPRNKRVRFQ